jgi:hypothetical protein
MCGEHEGTFWVTRLAGGIPCVFARACSACGLRGVLSAGKLSCVLGGQGGLGTAASADPGTRIPGVGVQEKSA